MGKVRDLIADLDSYEADIPSVKVAKADLMDTLSILQSIMPDRDFIVYPPIRGVDHCYELWDKDWKIAKTRTAHEMFRFIEGMLAMHTILKEKDGI